ncbi:MAG: ferritin family protein [Deltaproteobacteria bacterium]|nr:ferritin family protein [Deltaproteobacteria bacterium]
MTTQLDFTTLDLQDALDLAILIEKEAEERYTQFATMLGATDGAEIFEKMSRNEKAHGDELRARREKLFGDAPSRMHEDMIQDVEAPDMHQPSHGMSVRAALEVAMRSEKKAHDFFAAALPSIEDAEVKALFEELRDEEIEHQQLLEEQMGRYPETLEPDIDPDSVETPAL